MRELAPPERAVPVEAAKAAPPPAPDPILQELLSAAHGPVVEDATDVDAAQHWQAAARAAAQERGLAVDLPALLRPRRRPLQGVRWERLTRLVLAFLMALLLWLYVIGLENPARTQTYANLQLEVRGLAEGLAGRSTLPLVTVQVQAPEDVLRQLRAADFRPYVDATGLGAGRQTLKVQVGRPNGLVQLQLDPAEVVVQLDQKTTGTFAVRLKTLGSPGVGYQLEGPQIITPTQIVVAGWQDQVARVNEVVAEVDISGRQTTQTAQVRPRALDGDGHEVAGLTYEPELVQIAVSIQLFVNLKTLPVRVAVEGDPAPGYHVTDISVAPTTLLVQGLPNDLEKLNSLDTAPVSIAGLSQTLSLAVPVVLPPGVLLSLDQPANVQVRVAVEEITTRTTLAVRVRAQGLEPGFEATLSPDQLDARISGPFEALQNIDPAQVGALVDLSGRGPGTYTLTPAVVPPLGTKLLSVTPPSLTVTITALPTPVPTSAPTLPPLPTPTPTVPPRPPPRRPRPP